MALLEVRGLSKRFGGVAALKGVDLEVREGEIVGVIGPNGAGKTSFFNCITGLVRVDEGTVLFRDGHVKLNGLSPDRILEAGVARTFQNLRIFRNMTLLENVSIGFHARTGANLFDALLHTRRHNVEEKKVFAKSAELLAVVGLDRHGDELAGNLAYGDQKRLEIARALACEPKILLLDEPVAGMNSTEKLGIADLVRRIRKDRGLSILLIEHDMRVVMPLCDRIAVIDEGAKIAEGRPEAIKCDPRVVAAYLGECADA
jgi:branched-chain amino acid transport system ATP-binding protein